MGGPSQACALVHSPEEGAEATGAQSLLTPSHWCELSSSEERVRPPGSTSQRPALFLNQISSLALLDWKAKHLTPEVAQKGLPPTL